MNYQQELKSRFGLDGIEYRYNLDKKTLFHEALANDRGRIRPDGPDDEPKAYATKLGDAGPLVFYTDPSCTGRPVQDTFGVAWPEYENQVWWKSDFQKFDPDKFDPLV